MEQIAGYESLIMGHRNASDKLNHELGVMRDMLSGADGIGIDQEVIDVWTRDFDRGTLFGDLVRAIAIERNLEIRNP